MSSTTRKSNSRKNKMQAAKSAIGLLVSRGYSVYHDPTVSTVAGVWDLVSPTGTRKSVHSVRELCQVASDG